MIKAALPPRPLKPCSHKLPKEEWYAFKNWLFVWVLLANSGFMLMYFIGSPPRSGEILTFGAVGLLVRHRSYWTQLIAFLLVTVYSVLSFIAGLFNLAITSLAHSMVFVAELDIAQSVEYIVGGALLLGLFLTACLLFRKKTGFQDARLTVLAVLAVVGLATVDTYLGYGMRGHYERENVEGTPFESAMHHARIGLGSTPLERNLLVVMVESMGVPIYNPEMRDLLFARYDDQAVRTRFEVTTGTSTYFGSTTSGEVRELCGRWGDYYDLLDSSDPGCLPAMLASKGVSTTAYHSFDGEFFDRKKWYPNIGFQRSYFRDELIEGGAARCGGVFPGACDRDVPSQIAQRFKNGSEPEFVYWLTVNTHLPVPKGSNLEVEDCERISPRLAQDYPMICRQFAIWDSVDEALIEEITANDFPATDILIVGDHMPPYFDRRNRVQFAPDRVPWLLLQWRD